MFKDSNLLGSCAVLTDSYRSCEEAQSHLQSSGCHTVKMKVLGFSEISVTIIIIIIIIITYSVALVRERTIPTERPPPVGEVSANFCG